MRIDHVHFGAIVAVLDQGANGSRAVASESSRPSVSPDRVQ
jgi:hypothetical protein